MNGELRPVPTSLGSLLGGAGGYALAHFSDMDSRGKALMSAAGAALGGGLGYLGSRNMGSHDTRDDAILEARRIMRNKNDRERTTAAALTAATGTGLVVGGVPLLAERHHKDYKKGLTKNHKDWLKQVRALATADELAAVDAGTKKYGDVLLGKDLTQAGLPYKMWDDKVNATALERVNKRYNALAEKLLRDNPGILTEADLTKPGVPMNMWRRNVRETAAAAMSDYIKEVDKQIIKNNGVTPSGLFIPQPGTPQYKAMYKDKIREAVAKLKDRRPQLDASYIPAAGSAEWNAELKKVVKDVRKELAADRPDKAASFIINPADLSVKNSLARKIKARRLVAARAKLAGTKPSAQKFSKLVGTLKKRRRLYGGLGLAATLGAMGLADWATKDSSLD